MFAVPNRPELIDILPFGNYFLKQISIFFNDKVLVSYFMSQGNRRDTLTVLSDLLENMEEPRRLTRLLYASNLSYSQFSKYLKMVKQMGLAQEQNEPFRSYKVTNEGKNFMEMVKKRKEN